MKRRRACRATVIAALFLFSLLCGCGSPQVYRRVTRDVDIEGPNMTIDAGESTGDAARIAPSRAGLPAATVEDDRRGSAPADRESYVVVPESRVRGRARLYRVRKGDSLSKIARKFYGDDWEDAAQRIFQANRDLIRDPDVLSPGIQIRLP